MKKTLISVIRNSRGSTLMELVVALAVGSVVMAGVADVSFELIKGKVGFEKKMSASFEASILSKVFRDKVYMGGGNGLSPWQSVFVENNCAARAWFPDCKGSDRLTAISNRIEFTGNKKKFAANIPVYQYETASGQVIVMNPAAPVDTPCPLEAAKKYDHILLQETGSTNMAIRWVQDIEMATCTLKTKESRQAKIFEKFDPAVNTFNNVTMYMVDVTTFYLDTDTHQVKSVTAKGNEMAALEEDEIRVVTSQIYDFQAALGYDVGVKDLTVADKSDDKDEILYNHSADTLATLGSGGALSSDLQALYVAFTIGDKDTKAGNKIRNFDGPLVSENQVKMSAFREKYTFRNLMTFQ